MRDGLGLRRRSGGAAVTDVIHLRGSERPTGVRALDRPLLLGERWLNRLRLRTVDEWAKLVRGARIGPLLRILDSRRGGSLDRHLTGWALWLDLWSRLIWNRL